MTEQFNLTEYSHGAGCGCKISPAVLADIIKSQLVIEPDPNLLVGNSSLDDAAAYDIGGGQVILSTTDFFMPIVNDAFDFGRIAATNAISDIYAMGGKPIMAIAILGWPVDKLPASVGQKVVDGGRQACADAGIQLAGGHSIDAPEPIFGLAVTGIVAKDRLKQNNQARAGDRLYLTKPLGIGILTTAEKQQKLRAEDQGLATRMMCQLNTVGAEVSALKGVSAITDVTGFGLMGHLSEICEGSGLSALIKAADVPLLPPVHDYLAAGCIPGGTLRNFDSYGHKLAPMSERSQQIFCDPQTSGGLLIAVSEEGCSKVEEMLAAAGCLARNIGSMQAARDDGLLIEVQE